MKNQSFVFLVTAATALFALKSQACESGARCFEMAHQIVIECNPIKDNQQIEAVRIAYNSAPIAQILKIEVDEIFPARNDESRIVTRQMLVAYPRSDKFEKLEVIVAAQYSYPYGSENTLVAIHGKDGYISLPTRNRYDLKKQEYLKSNATVIQLECRKKS